MAKVIYFVPLVLRVFYGGFFKEKAVIDAQSFSYTY